MTWGINFDPAFFLTHSPLFSSPRLDELQSQADRIATMRRRLYEALHVRDPHRNWTHVTRQTGMFSYTGLSASQCEKLIGEHHVYLLNSGRINVSGIPADAIEHLADAVCAVVGKASDFSGSVESLDSLTDNLSEMSSSSDAELDEEQEKMEQEAPVSKAMPISSRLHKAMPAAVQDAGAHESCCSSVSD